MPNHTNMLACMCVLSCHVTCLMAVRKPWGLKNPVIQNALGLPWNIQALNCWSLSRSSVYQKPMVEESQDICVIDVEGVNVNPCLLKLIQ